jgi:hypothetical protein
MKQQKSQPIVRTCLLGYYAVYSQSSKRLHCATTQETVITILSAMRTSNLTVCIKFYIIWSEKILLLILLLLILSMAMPFYPDTANKLNFKNKLIPDNIH